MSRLSDAIDANRNRATGQTGGSTGLQKAGRPTGTQGTSSTKTTQTSSRVGGGSVLSQAIDRARSGETVERATGVQLPQSFRGLTDTQRSGVSTTPSASSLFQNRFNRDSGGSRTATTTQRRTTAGGFYSMPDFGAESQRLESEARTAQSAMNAKKTELESAYSTMTELEKSAQFYGQQAQSIYETYLQNQDPTWGSLFERASANYERANQEYSAAAETFNTLYSEYEPLLNSYNQAAEAYNQYVGSQQEQYSAWRSTIRSQDAIQQDIAATDAAIQELTSQRNNLNRQKSNANRYRGIGLEEGADEKIKSLDAQVEDLEATKTLLQEELEWSQYFRYADLTQAEDFAELSQYRSTANGQEPEFNAWSGMYTETGFDDINYDIINRNEEAMGHQMVNDIQTNASFLGLDNSERKQMTDEEIAIFNYLYAQDTARGDTEHSTAYGYIDYLTGDLNYRQRQADEQAWAEYARESPVASSVFSVITSPLKGLSYLGQAADYLEDREIDQNAGYNKFSYMNSAIRDEVTGIVEDKWGGVGSFAYNTGMSMADFLFNTAVSGGNQAVALAIMGTGAAADTTIDAKDRGLSDDQAFALGTIAGAAEIITEKVSLDRLFNTDWEKGALKYILGNAFTEGSEEVASDTINLFADILIAKDKSEWQTSIDAYMEQGMTREEAMGKAVADQAAQMGLDFLGGAISGGVMSGGASVGNAVSTYNTGRALNRMNLEEGDLQAIIQEGLASDPSTRSYQEAVRLQQQMEQGKTPGTYQLGSLYRANIRAIDAEQQGAELLQRARQELDERGSVRNGTARSILENVNAVNTLTAQAGLNLTDSMNQRQRREAVKQAINNFSTSTETDVETGSDTGVQQTEGVVLPTAEDLENQNQQAAEVQTDAAVDTTTEPGMLPTAEQLEVQQRLKRASTDLERSGIQAGAREENIQTVQRLSDILGRNIRFYDGRTREAGDPSGAANGYYDLDEDTIYVNSRSRNPVAQIVSHELTHSVETADAYADLSELVLNRIQQTGGNLEQLRREKAELYARRGARLPSQKAIDQEIVANYVERYLLTDEQSIRELTQQNRSLGQRILSWLNQLLAKLGNASAQERAFLTQARDTYARALQQTQTSFNQQTQQAAPAAGQSTQQTTGPPIMEGGGTAQVQEQQTRPAEETRRAEPEAAQEAQEGRRRQPVSEPDPEAQRRRSEAQDALEGLREDYAAGRITEEEFDAALDAIMEEEGLAGEEMLEQYSIDENYERDIDEWDAQGRPDGEVFILGSTGDVLQGLGAMEQDIYLRSEKVNTILQQHPEMTLAEIKRIPEILDDPVLVLKSRNVGRGGQQNTRLVLFGTVRAENGQPVLAVLDLRPVENGLAIDDMQKVTSSYTKDSNPVWYVQNSDILHADKNRTIPLLRTIGFQMPIELQRSGSMGSISYNRQNVNIQGVPFDQVVDTTQQQEDGRQYSVEEEAQLPTAEETERDIISTMPVKAQQYLRRAERYLLDKVGGLLNVPRYAKREYLQDIVREISLEYLREGRVSEDTVDSLFERAYDEGVVVEREFYDQYADLRNYLRTTRLTIAPEDSADIADFNDFRKSNFGRLNISTQGGTNIDQVYQELADMWPEFFNEERHSHPADQLLHIADVAQSFQVAEKSLDEYYGPEAEEFRRWARHDFEAAVYDAVSELRSVRRYVEDRAAQAGVEAPPTTQAEVTEMWGRLKDARRTYEKAAARNLLTEHDEVQVGRLLRGEIELEHLDPARDNVRGITAVYEAKQEYERLTRLIRQWNQSRKAALRQQADRYLQTANDWKDKKAGILYSRETMERNIRDIVNDETLAEEINQTYFTPVHDAAAAANRMKNQYRDRVRELNLSRNVAKGNVVSEAHAVQLLGEAEDNIRMLEQSRGRMKARDGKSLEDWRGVVDDLWAENPNLDADKIRAAVAQFRTIYDELFQQMNEVRVRNGYEPVNYRRGYFPHFQPGNGDGILAQFGKALGIDTEVTALPTTINGLTHTFRPGIRWFGNAQERMGFNTAYDAVEGFDRYIEGVADVIHQTDNIQRLRALASQMRYRTGDEGIRKQVDAVVADPNLTEQDKQNRIEKIYETGRYTLSNFVVELEEYTNLLANKKSRADRNMEQALGRNMYNLVKALESRVAANMVAVNPASWLTNFIPLTQGGALLDRGMLLKGMWDTLKAYKVDDGIVDKSSFLTNRRGSDPIVRAWAQRASATASRPMEYIDQFVADSLVRARYRQNLGKNMSEDAAMAEADAFAASVMADRSKGATPTLFNRSNPLTKVFTQFQLEVNNQLSYLFKDMPRDTRDKGIAALAAALLKFFLGAWLFDELYEYVIGRRPGLDPIGILNDAVGDLTGYELPNLVELGVGAASGNIPSFQVEQAGLTEAGANLAGSALEQLPFIGGVLGGGRVPISSAIPDIGNLWNALTNEDWSTGKRLQEVRDELLEKPLVYLGLPFGGGQLKKIYEGIEGVIQGGSYSVNAEGEQELQYPIYNDTAGQAIGNALLAATFGRTSLPTGRDWIEGGFDTLGAKQTAVYQGLLEAGVPGEEAYALLKELRGAEKTETESEAAQERRLLQEADISGDGKSIVYYGLMASDRERELMDELADIDADMGEVTTALLGIKDAGALKGAAASNAKRDAIAGAALSEDEQIRLYNYTFGEKQDDGSYVSSRAEDIAAFREAGMTFDQFLEAQNEYSTINEEYDSSSEKAVEFARWVNGQGLTEEQAAVVKDAFTYYSQIPQSGGYYEKFTEAGMNDESAYSLNQALDELEPLEGEDQVSSLQKYQAVVNSDLTESEQMTAMGELMPETEYEKLRVGSLQGVTPRAYVSYKQTLPLYDTDGNGSFKQEEVQAALDSLPLTTEQRAALWQMQNKSWKPSSNPYSVSVSQQVYDALNAEEEDDGGLMNWSGGITLPTAEELEQNGLMNWN